VKKVSEIFVCDICKREEVKMQSINYPVLFLTEQTEGRAVPAYISQTKLDVCQECLPKIVKLQASGAMGNNTYTIIKREA